MKKFLLLVFCLAVIGGVVWYLRGAIPVIAPTGTGLEPASETITGFTVDVFAKNLPGARDMEWDDVGNLLVSLPGEGKIVAVRDADGDGTAEQQTTVLSNLRKPHGIAMRCVDGCKLYVAEEHALSEYTYSNKTATNRRVLTDLPTGGRHTTRSIMFLPAPDDNVLLVSIGSSCDVCNEENDQRATIMAFELEDEDEPYLQPVATGLRNSVFMAIHPIDGSIWATEMGRDGLGDDLPPDEINIIEKKRNYGWPICYGQNIHDADFDPKTYIRSPCMKPMTTPAHIDLPAHVAPLGLAFIPEEGWPEDWWYNLLVAEHGSWNSTTPVGYKIVRLKLDADGNYLGTEDFLTGFLKDGVAIGRPVDIIVQPGGVVYVSDDKAGMIYRLSRSQQEDTGDPDVRLESPLDGERITSPLTVKGQARGTWFFEASFPVELLDGDGNSIATGIAQAQGDWMTEGFVPFEVTLTFDRPMTPTGILILKKDNPSGLSKHDAELRIPVRFGKPTASIPLPTGDGCVVSGCNNEICADEEMVSSCIYKDEHACYERVTCERQLNGECGWTQTPILTACLGTSVPVSPGIVP